MKLFNSNEFNSLEDLFIEQIQDLYDAEKRLVEALPKMAEAANNPQLQSALKDHLRETQGHVQRLEQVFQQIEKKPARETCEAMKGLIQEGEEMVEAKGNPDVKDAALIAAGQRIEHYEMAGYGTARAFAERLGHTEAAKLLQQTLDEEKAADHALTGIAEQTVNLQAQTA